MQLSLVAVILGGVAKSYASLGSYQVFESVSNAPAPWTVDDASEVDQNLKLKLRIHVKNQNIAAFQQQVYDVSTPDHPSYGRHFAQSEINDMLAPRAQSFELVSEWLESLGLTEKSTVENDWVIIDGTVGDAEKLLQAKYQTFENVETGRKTIRTLQYSLPVALDGHVDMVAPTIKFSTASPKVSYILKDYQVPDVQFKQSTAADIHDGLDVVACNSSITPDCLKALYKFKHFRGSRRNGNELALAGFLEEYAQHDDLAQFLETYAPNENGSDFSTALINGGLNLQDSVDGFQNIVEANLDIQYGLSLAYPTPTTYYSTAGRPPETTNYEVDNEPYLEFLTYLLKLEKIPQTISISYGDGEWTVPPSYAHTVCDLFAQVAARGVSVLVSSGDGGSGGNCSTISASQLLYSPDFPASCPFVTAVGATYAVEPEIAVGFSGGGFSNLFTRPAYQDAAVSNYLTNHADPLYTKYFNASGRAYPDVSAQGVSFHTIITGQSEYVSGTSASSPAFAGLVALLNSDRISNGLAPFGLLNPWLYTKGVSGMTDIVNGKSIGCYSQIPGAGFPAVVGWDPATGLGTPDFKKLRLASTGIES